MKLKNIVALGLLRGQVVRFPEFKELKVPHTGWNQLHPARVSPLLEGLPDGSYAYTRAGNFKLDDKATVPSHVQRDGLDFEPAKASYLLPQHFSAIAAAGPVVGPILAATRKTCVSTGIAGTPNDFIRTTLAVLRPTPASSMSSSRVFGTLPPNFSTITRAAAIMFFDFAL